VSEFAGATGEGQLARKADQPDPRIEQVASLHLTLHESEGDYEFSGYASSPRENKDYWIIHVSEKGKIIHDTTLPRLDGGATFSHNDLTILGAEVDRLKRIFSTDITTVPSI